MLLFLLLSISSIILFSKKKVKGAFYKVLSTPNLFSLNQGKLMGMAKPSNNLSKRDKDAISNFSIRC